MKPSVKTLDLTGGGTAGHVMPNLALKTKLESQGWILQYIGAKGGMEQDLLRRTTIPFHGIAAGKLRRYFDVKNFTDPFKIVGAFFQSIALLKKLHVNLVFSKGGFVTVPVVWAAKALSIPVILHESDLTPGLANRLCLPFASRLCVSFPETLNHLRSEKLKAKSRLTGLPIRSELLLGDKAKGRAALSLPNDNKPILIVMGGSLGSRIVNQAIRNSLGTLLATYYVVHLCGKGNLDSSLDSLSGYRQREFLHDELPDVLAAASLAISRAGANAIFELLALRLPHILIPLSRAASRGDQIDNAAAFEKLGYSRVIQEESLTAEHLQSELIALEGEADSRRKAMQASPFADGINRIAEVISEVS